MMTNRQAFRRAFIITLVVQLVVFACYIYRLFEVGRPGEVTELQIGILIVYTPILVVAGVTPESCRNQVSQDLQE